MEEQIHPSMSRPGLRAQCCGPIFIAPVRICPTPSCLAMQPTHTPRSVAYSGTHWISEPYLAGY